jgi:TRAP-type C4-dicarboxylate transport system permease small subunit
MEVLYDFLRGVAEEILNPLILLLLALAFLLFFWGVFDFIRNAGESEKRAEGQKAILWGIIGISIMFGAYGILNIGTATFGIDPVERGFLQTQ